ncbi:MAG TPA: DUF1571 domain-containing protein [bacterium]|nr:DUF1571 domain-containing protein [bacterium]
MRFLLPALFAAVLSIPLLASSPATDPTPADLMQRMLTAVGQVRTCTYRLVKQERIDGRLQREETQVKLQNKPFRVYIKSINPNAGREVLYATGTNDNKALVNIGKFAPNVSLDPYGARVRQGQHHTLFDIGFRRITEVMVRQVEENRDELTRLLRLDPTPATFDNRPCWVVRLEDPRFRFTTYTVRPGGESIDQIAHHLGVSEYMIAEKLPGFDGDYRALLPAGKQIKVPTTYARRLTVLIDKATHLLVSITISDDQGIFEQYDYHDLKINTPFRENEFTPEFKGYSF